MDPAEPLTYEAARHGVRHGDVLLFRGRGVFSWTIKRRTRSVYSHAALAFWIGSRLMVAESRERYGVRLVPASAAAESGRLDVYSPVQMLRPDEADLVFDRALELLGQPYGWREILRIAASKVPGWPTRTWSDDDDAGEGTAPICSQYVALCYRAAGRDLVPNLADASTTPGDLGRSAALRRRLVIEG